MSVLITQGLSPFAQRVAKLNDEHPDRAAMGVLQGPVFFADSASIPDILIGTGRYHRIPSPDQSTFVHELLKLALDLGVDRILPLDRAEALALNEAKLLFTEYGIQVMAPTTEAMPNLQVLVQPQRGMPLWVLDVADAVDSVNPADPADAAESVSSANPATATAKLAGIFSYNDEGEPYWCLVSATPQRKVTVFELDDVLFPAKDYLLQVYYLFANFVEFTAAQPPAAELLTFMKESFEQEGPNGIFERAAKKFPAIERFRDNFDRLHHQAQLPLKLELYPDKLHMIKKMRDEGNQVFILTSGDPLMQLNKIRQIDWQGLDQFVKVYFEDELRFRNLDPLSFLLEDNGISREGLDVSHIKKQAVPTKNRMKQHEQ